MKVSLRVKHTSRTNKRALTNSTFNVFPPKTEDRVSNSFLFIFILFILVHYLVQINKQDILHRSMVLKVSSLPLSHKAKLVARDF